MQTCPECDAKIMEYKHSLSKGLVRVLKAIIDAGGAARFDDLPLSFSDKNNAQKLQYWDFIEHDHKGDPWRITEDGINWVEGRSLAPKITRTYRGKTVGYDGPLVNVRDINEPHRQTADYIEDAVPHIKESR